MFRNMNEDLEYLRHILPLTSYSVGPRHLSLFKSKKQKPRQSIRAFLCVNTYMEMIDSAPVQMDSVRVLSIDGFRTKAKAVHSVDVYPILSLNHLICRH